MPQTTIYIPADLAADLRHRTDMRRRVSAICQEAIRAALTERRDVDDLKERLKTAEPSGWPPQ